MKKKGIYGVLLCTLFAAVFTGCGDGTGENSNLASGEVAVLSAEPVLTDTEREILNYELKYSTGEFTMEDYQALAGLYSQAGQIRSQRDMLEQSYRLYQDMQSLEILQEITVNLLEEDPAVLGEAQTMLQNLELSDYVEEAVHMIGSEEWIETMMPKLYLGRRNYFLSKEGQIVLAVQAGFDETGSPFSNVWYHSADGKITLLKRTGDTVQLLNTGLSDGAYDGAFDLWTIVSGSSSLCREQGTFAKGVFTGDYTADVYIGGGAGDFYDLWTNRETMEYKTYTGNFDGEGKTTLEQPSEAEVKALLEGSGSKDCVVYAYGEDGGSCLFQELGEDMEKTAFGFRAETVGLDAYPVFSVYEVEQEETAGPDPSQAPDASAAPGETAEPEDAGIRVRIFDGEVQYFDGKKWVDAGSVKSLEKEDPFRQYFEEYEEHLNSDGQNKTGGQRFHAGTVPTATPAAPPATQKPADSKPTNKPAANKPANKPVVTPAPQPAAPPAQEPDDDDDDGGSDDGGSGGNTDNGANNGGDNNGGDNGGGDNGGDVDIEWTDDIL